MPDSKKEKFNTAQLAIEKEIKWDKELNNIIINEKRKECEKILEQQKKINESLELKVTSICVKVEKEMIDAKNLTESEQIRFMETELSEFKRLKNKEVRDIRLLYKQKISEKRKKMEQNIKDIFESSKNEMKLEVGRAFKRLQEREQRAVIQLERLVNHNKKEISRKKKVCDNVYNSAGFVSHDALLKLKKINDSKLISKKKSLRGTLVTLKDLNNYLINKSSKLKKKSIIRQAAMIDSIIEKKRVIITEGFQSTKSINDKILDEKLKINKNTLKRKLELERSALNEEREIKYTEYNEIDSINKEKIKRTKKIYENLAEKESIMNEKLISTIWNMEKNRFKKESDIESDLLIRLKDQSKKRSSELKKVLNKIDNIIHT